MKSSLSAANLFFMSNGMMLALRPCQTSKTRKGSVLDVTAFKEKYKINTNFLCYIGLCNAIPKHWRKVFGRDNENDLVVSDESVQPFKNSPPTCRQAHAFYVSESFQKPTSEVRLFEAGFTDRTIAASYVLPFKLTKK